MHQSLVQAAKITRTGCELTFEKLLQEARAAGGPVPTKPSMQQRKQAEVQSRFSEKVRVCHGFLNRRQLSSRINFIFIEIENNFEPAL